MDAIGSPAHSSTEDGPIFVVLKPKLALEQRDERRVLEPMPPIHKDPVILLLAATLAATAFWAALVII